MVKWQGSCGFYTRSMAISTARSFTRGGQRDGTGRRIGRCRSDDQANPFWCDIGDDQANPFWCDIGGSEAVPFWCDSCGTIESCRTGPSNWVG